MRTREQPAGGAATASGTPPPTTPTGADGWRSSLMPTGGRASSTATWPLAVSSRPAKRSSVSVAGLDEPGAKGAASPRGAVLLASGRVAPGSRRRSAGRAGVAAPRAAADAGAGRDRTAAGPRPAGRSGSWPRPRRRWRLWEKHTRSWSCSPRARTPSRRRRGDHPCCGRARRADLDRAGVRAAGAPAGQPLSGPAAAGATATRRGRRRRTR